MKVKIKNVRLSFPQLFQPRAFSADQDPRYSASFLLDLADNAEDITRIKEVINEVGAEKWSNRWKDTKFKRSVKMCLHKGEDKEQYDGYDDSVMFISSNSPASDRPLTLDRRRNVVTEEDGILYAGCFVHAQLDIWAQDNQYGKRINAKVLGVQFYREGDSFSAGSKASVDDFEDEGEEEHTDADMASAFDDDPLA